MLLVLRFAEAFFVLVGGPEGLRDDNVGVDELALEGAVSAILVGGDDELVSLGFQELAQAQFARDAAEQRAWLEVRPAWGRQGLPIRIALDPGQIVARVGDWITVDGIVVEDAEDFRHESAFLPRG